MTDVGQAAVAGDESYRNPSLSGCCSKIPPSGDKTWTGPNLLNLISFRGIKEILTLTKGKESIKGKETVDTLQSAGWPDMRKYFLC